MDRRLDMARAFVEGTDWGGGDIAFLAGDASNRRYFRVTRAGASAVLMDAPPEKGEDVRPFIAIAEHLTALGLSAPQILARDARQGFLLLEDLGDALFARVIPGDAALEHTLYTAATDVLITLHRAAPPTGLAAYDTGLMADMAALAFDWYLGAPGHAMRDAAHNAMRTTLDRHAGAQDVLIQRDYHAENLLWLPGRAGIARVGLLDFQDAMRGHRAYDLVSLLQDARRDVPPALATEMRDYYTTNTAQNVAEFDAAYHVLGAQRNLRIIGVFARLCLRDGKAHYVDMIPRVWAHLQTDLNHPALRDLRTIIDAALPGPTPEILKGLKDRCAPRPAP